MERRTHPCRHDLRLHLSELRHGVGNYGYPKEGVHRDNEYFSIISTCKGYQVIRFFFVRCRQKVGQKAEYSICEVAQRWITPNGKSETVARLRNMSVLYYDLWNEDSPMEIRKNNQHRVYDIDPICTYPRQRIIPEIKRNGFDGNLYGILPYDFFKSILTDNRAETLLKARQYPMLRYYIRCHFNMVDYWQSVKICIRNGYTIPDGSIWRDTIDLLRYLGKDTNNPKYVSPKTSKSNTTDW